MLLRGTVRSLTLVFFFQVCSSLPRTPYFISKITVPSHTKMQSLLQKVVPSCFPSLFSPFQVLPWLPTFLTWVSRDRASSSTLGKPNLSLSLCPKSHFQNLPGSMMLP